MRSANEAFEPTAETVEFPVQMKAVDTLAKGLSAIFGQAGDAVIGGARETGEPMLDVLKQLHRAVSRRWRIEGPSGENRYEAKADGDKHCAAGILAHAVFHLMQGRALGVWFDGLLRERLGWSVGFGVGGRDGAVVQGRIGFGVGEQQSSTALMTPSDKRAGRTSVAATAAAAPASTRVGIRLMRSPTPKAAATALVGSFSANSRTWLRSLCVKSSAGSPRGVSFIVCNRCLGCRRAAMGSNPTASLHAGLRRHQSPAHRMAMRFASGIRLFSQTMRKNTRSRHQAEKERSVQPASTALIEHIMRKRFTGWKSSWAK